MAVHPQQIYSLAKTGLSLIRTISGQPTKVEIEINKLSRKIDIRLDVINKKVDDFVSRQIVSGFVSIVDAIGTKDKTEFMNLMVSAHKSFTEISRIQSNGTTHIQGKNIPNSFVAGMGFYGRYLYFALVNRPGDALKEVYECSSIYPEAGVLLFDRCFFSDNYYDKLLDLNNKISEHLIKDIRNVPESFTLFPVKMTVTNMILEMSKIDTNSYNLDENGVILSFEKEDLLDLIKNECSFILKELKSGGYL